MIEVSDLTFAYSRQSKPIFQRFNLRIETGERVGVAGKSGSGKSTLCKLLSNHLKASAGAILINGQAYRHGYNPVQLVLQHPEFAFNPYITLRESLREVYAADEYLSHLALFELDQKLLDRYPNELSGGELQRIAILRALKRETQYLVADELTAMMDSYTQALIWNAVQVFLDQQGCGLIMVAHDQDLLDRMVHRVIILGTD